MKCKFKQRNKKLCQKETAKWKRLCFKHDPKIVPLYITADYAGYKRRQAKYISSPLADWFITRGIALRHDRTLQAMFTRLNTGKLCLVHTKSEEELKDLLMAVRVMISAGQELNLFRFFNTNYEPHYKIMRDFVTHEWFTDEERAYMQSFIQKHFIDQMSYRHQIKRLTRIKKREIRLAKMSTKQSK